VTDLRQDAHGVTLTVNGGRDERPPVHLHICPAGRPAIHTVPQPLTEPSPEACARLPGTQLMAGPARRSQARTGCIWSACPMRKAT
jgi:hypothetical protein